MRRQLLALLIVLAAVAPASAATVGMNFKFHVNSLGTDIIHVNGSSYLGQSINTTFRPEKPYISAEYGSALAALVFAGGGFLNIRLDTAADPYSFFMLQEEQGNRFLIAVTDGNWQEIDAQASSRRVPQRTFGGLPVPFANPQNIFLRLNYETLRLAGAIASGQVLVKNLGSRVISLELVG
jgi:hypothetical protein